MKALRIASLILAVAMILVAIIYGTIVTSYKDVEESRWSHGSIIYASKKGYMDGVGAGKFDPTGTMQRAMIVTVLYRMEKEPGIGYSDVFVDVPPGKYYTKAVLWAYKNDIVTGVTSDTFDPTGAVTREQMATFFCRYAEYKKIDTSAKSDITGYEDYDMISSYAVDAIAWANKVGLISGDTPTTLSPKKTATREQFSAVLKRYDDARLLLRQSGTSK